MHAKQDNHALKGAHVLMLYAISGILVSWWMTPLYDEASGYFFQFSGPRFAGKWPFIDYWMEYPPPIPYLMLGLNRITISLAALFTGTSPTGPDHRLAQTFGSMVSSLMALVDTLSLWLLIRIRRQLGADWKESVLMYLALFFPLFCMGSFLESMPVCLMLAAVYFLLSDRVHLSALSLGAGTAIKIFPFVLLPLVWLKAEGKTARKKCLLFFCLPVLCSMGPFLLLHPRMCLAFVHCCIARPPWETIFALFAGIHTYGDLGPLIPTRFQTDVSFAYSATPADRIFYLACAGLVLAPLVQSLRRIGRLEPTRILQGSLLLVSALFLVSKGWSPQFILFLIPLCILALDVKQALYCLVPLEVVNFLEMRVWLPMRYTDAGEHLLYGIVIFRTLLLYWIFREMRLKLQAPDPPRTSIRHGYSDDPLA